MKEFPPPTNLTPETGGSLGKEAAEEIENDRIKMESFIGHPLFPTEEIEADIATCMSRETGFSLTNSHTPESAEIVEKGKIAEQVLRQAIADSWLVPKEGKTVGIVTSKYDDYIRGIDLVTQIILGSGKYDHLGMSMDFTISDLDVGKKLRGTFDQIDQGYTPSVKYFMSEKTGILKNFKMPRLVIAASKDNINRLAGYYQEIAHHTSSEGKATRALTEDPFKHVVYGEIIVQLDVFCRRLQSVMKEAESQKNVDLFRRAADSLSNHQKVQRIITSLMTEHNITIDMIHKHIRGDSAANQIAIALSALNKTPIRTQR